MTLRIHNTEHGDAFRIGTDNTRRMKRHTAKPIPLEIPNQHPNLYGLYRIRCTVDDFAPEMHDLIKKWHGKDRYINELFLN